MDPVTFLNPVQNITETTAGQQSAAIIQQMRKRGGVDAYAARGTSVLWGFAGVLMIAALATLFWYFVLRPITAQDVKRAVEKQEAECLKESATLGVCAQGLFATQEIVRRNQTTLNEVQKELAKAKKDMMEAGRKDPAVRQQLQHIETELVRVKNQISTVQQDNQQILAAIQTALGEHTRVSAKLSAQQAQVALLNEKVNKLEDQVQAQALALTAADKHLQRTLQNPDASKKKKLAATQDALAAAIREQTLLRSEAAALDRVKAKLDAQIADSTKKTTSAKREAFLLMSRINDHQATITQNLNAADAAQTKLNNALQTGTSTAKTEALVNKRLSQDQKQEALLTDQINTLGALGQDLRSRTIINPNKCAQNTSIRDTLTGWLNKVAGSSPQFGNGWDHQAWAVQSNCSDTSIVCSAHASGNTIMEAHQNALRTCNAQCGGNPCMVIFQDSHQILCPRSDIFAPPNASNNKCRQIKPSARQTDTKLEDVGTCLKNPNLLGILRVGRLLAEAEPRESFAFAMKRTCPKFPNMMWAWGDTQESASQRALAQCNKRFGDGQCTIIMGTNGKSLQGLPQIPKDVQFTDTPLAPSVNCKNQDKAIRAYLNRLAYFGGGTGRGSNKYALAVDAKNCAAVFRANAPSQDIANRLAMARCVLWRGNQCHLLFENAARQA
jgi:hypothetical protein